MAVAVRSYISEFNFAALQCRFSKPGFRKTSLEEPQHIVKGTAGHL